MKYILFALIAFALHGAAFAQHNGTLQVYTGFKKVGEGRYISISRTTGDTSHIRVYSARDTVVLHNHDWTLVSSRRGFPKFVCAQDTVVKLHAGTDGVVFVSEQITNIKKCRTCGYVERSEGRVRYLGQIEYEMLENVKR